MLPMVLAAVMAAGGPASPLQSSNVVRPGAVVVSDHVKAPPPFDFADGQRAVFVDFEAATYDLVFEYDGPRATVVTTIDFLQPSLGYPLFDLVPDTIAGATLDDRPVDIDTVRSPDGVSRFRVVLAESGAGPHRLVLRSSFERGVRAQNGGISAGLFLNDWDDRSFLELYVPSNLEYDSYRMTFRITIEGATRGHEVFANAETIRVEAAEDLWEVRFPDFYNASHVYLHVVPEGELEERSFEFASAYRLFRVTVYGDSVSDRAVDAVVQSLRMLEEALGPWPHANLLVHLGRPGRSMEYAGATRSTIEDLQHELAHSYLGRWIAPAGGDASWFDEAAVMWLIDRGAPTASQLPRGSAAIGATSPYFRPTHQSSYGQGSEVLAHLDYLMRQNNDGSTLLTCLRHMAQEQAPEKLTTADIQERLEVCYGGSLQSLFDRHVYGNR